MADSQSPSFSEVLAEGIARPHIKVTSFLKMTIIPPFTKNHFKSNASFEAASKKTLLTSCPPLNPIIEIKLPSPKLSLLSKKKDYIL